MRACCEAPVAMCIVLVKLTMTRKDGGRVGDSRITAGRQATTSEVGGRRLKSIIHPTSCVRIIYLANELEKKINFTT